MLKFKFRSLKFRNDLTKVKERIKQNVASESFEILEIIDKNTEPLVPYETGKLRASVMRPNGMLIEGDFMSQNIEYSARNERTGYDYAFIQHENLMYRHRFGQALYLREGMFRSQDEVYNLIERDVNLSIKEVFK